MAETPPLPCPACGVVRRHTAARLTRKTTRDRHGYVFETVEFEARCAACGRRWIAERHYREPDTVVIGFIATWSYSESGRRFQHWADGTLVEEDW